jgi:hypothetical protein
MKQTSESNKYIIKECVCKEVGLGLGYTFKAEQQGIRQRVLNVKIVKV